MYEFACSNFGVYGRKIMYLPSPLLIALILFVYEITDYLLGLVRQGAVGAKGGGVQLVVTLLYWRFPHRAARCLDRFRIRFHRELPL